MERKNMGTLVVIVVIMIILSSVLGKKEKRGKWGRKKIHSLKKEKSCTNQKSKGTLKQKTSTIKKKVTSDGLWIQTSERKWMPLLMLLDTRISWTISQRSLLCVLWLLC